MAPLCAFALTEVTLFSMSKDFERGCVGTLLCRLKFWTGVYFCRGTECRPPQSIALSTEPHMGYARRLSGE